MESLGARSCHEQPGGPLEVPGPEIIRITRSMKLWAEGSGGVVWCGVVWCGVVWWYGFRVSTMTVMERIPHCRAGSGCAYLRAYPDTDLLRVYQGRDH